MKPNDLPKSYDLPDAKGHFGPYGGIFVSETLMHPPIRSGAYAAHCQTATGR